MEVLLIWFFVALIVGLPHLFMKGSSQFVACTYSFHVFALFFSVQPEHWFIFCFLEVFGAAPALHLTSGRNGQEPLKKKVFLGNTQVWLTAL